MHKEKKGNQVYLRRSDSLHAQSLADVLREFPRLPLSKLFTPSSLHVFSVLKSPRSITEASEITGLDRYTVSAAISRLARYGIVIKENGSFLLSSRHMFFEDFVDNYFKYRANMNLRAVSQNGVLIWQRGPEFLFKAEKLNPDLESDLEKKVHLTAISIFPKYGLDVITDMNYYFFSKRTPCEEEFLIHTILIDPYSPIYNSYALALAPRLRSKNFLKYAGYYHIEAHVRILLEYLDKKEKSSDFVLPWKEYKELLESLV
ncbi:ArsR family transcriptional regulator [Methanosarcina sp.]|uniref:ArsR family transcriptional regulator n=1 Tax=Methanosarcina sp. TaxID=2213 RepID=UPI002AB936BF|nr:ArsR family transcriptional regulator [Methanosarcina sp.]MDY9926893.1 ArsR family transcriptional regulator [Methanosarcina sp.]